MKIEFENTPEQIALIKALASKNKLEAEEAKEAFAAFLSPVIQEVLLQAGTSSLIYRDEPYDEDDSPSFPLDTLYGLTAGEVSIWSQTVGGGLPTNELSSVGEIKLRTYSLDTAISFEKRYAKRARLNNIARFIQFAANSLLIKQERNAWAVVLKMDADATTGTQNHVIRATTAGVFQLDDLNNLMTLARRIEAAFNGGTPNLMESVGLTDLFVSPEIKGQIRGFAYQPMNTRAGSITTSGATALGLPDSVREQIYRSAGTSEIFNVSIHEMLEFGEGTRKYNSLFSAFAGSKTFNTLGNTGGTAFDPATEQIVIGVDNSRDTFIRPVATHDENGGQIVTQVDDQFVARSGKIGWYSHLEEGRAALDKRAVQGLIV